MPFDVNSALKEGYNQTEIVDFLAKEKKFDVDSARKEGYTDDELIQYLNPTSKKESLLTNLQRGYETMKGDILTGGAGLLNPTEAAKKGLEREEEMRQRLGPQESRLSKVEKAYEDKGLLSAIGTGLSEIPGAITEQLPQLGVAFGGARAGAIAAAPLEAGLLATGVGAPAAGAVAVAAPIVGAFLPFFLQQYGGNIKQQAEVQKGKGEEVDVSGARGAGFAIPMAGLDVAAAYIPFGKQIVGKMFGPSVEKLLNRGLTKEAEEAAAKKLAEESFLPSFKGLDLGTVVKGTGKASLLEIPTEVTQQLLGRAQSGQDLFSKEAMREYGETAFDVALLGPLGVLGRVSDKSAARQSILDAQKKAAETKEPQEIQLLTYDPNVQGNTIYTPIIINPDGSTQFPSEKNKFVQNATDEFTQAGLRQAYAPQQGTIVPPPPPPRQIQPPIKTPEVMYAGLTGEVGESPESVQQSEYFQRQAAERQAKIQATITKDTIKSFGVGRTANIYKDAEVVGADIRDPAQATIVKNKLVNLRDKHSNKQVKQKINEFLSRPEFSFEAQATAPIPPSAPKINTAKTTPNEVWQFIQNRDRSTDASINQMNIIANDPQYDRASFSNSFTEGAPVVSGNITVPKNQLGRKGNIVTGDNQKIPVQYAVIDASQVMPSHNVNGVKNSDYVSPDYKGFKAITNGRVAGLQAGYARGTMDNYVAGLTYDDMHGISKDVIQSIKNPMLVRIMPSEMITKHTGDVSNTGAGLSLNVVEQAKNDINRINLEGVEFGENGEITEKSVREFIRAMPQTEQNNLMTKDGTPSKQAYDRLNAAIFQQAYQNNKLTELAFQSPDEEIKNIVRALNMAAPNAINLEGLNDYDIRPFVNEAVEMAVNAKRNSISLSNLVKQSDMTIHPLSKDILEMFSNNPRSARAIGENLNTLFDNAYKEGSQSADMFGEVQKKPIDEVIKDSFTKKPEEDLFTPKSELKQLSEEGLTVQKGRHPQVVAAARERQAGRISRAEYEEYVKKYMPFGKVESPSPPAGEEEMKNALDVNQKKLLNAPIETGTKVGLRMDIKALNRGASVVTVHPENNVNKTLSYRSVGHIKDVTFNVRNEKALLKVAAGETSKFPQQTVEGSWINTSPSEVYSKVKELLNNKDWMQIGVDPLRHSYFYDRQTGFPVKSADEVLQVGRFLLAKNAQLESKEKFLFETSKESSKISKEEQKLEAELKGKTLLEVSKWSVDNAPNKFAKIVANMIDKRLNAMSRRGIKFDFEIQSGNERLTKLYGAKGITTTRIGKIGEETSFTIVLNGPAIAENQIGHPSGMNYKTIAHELLHVATRGQLALRNSKDPLVIELNNLRNQIVKDFNKRAKEGNLTPFLERIYKKEINTLESVDELISWGLTDKDTQEYLSDIKVGEKTIFNKLVDIVRQLLGISKDYETALDRLIRTSESVLNEDVKVIAGRLEEAGYSYGKAEENKGFTGEQQTLFELSLDNVNPAFADKINAVFGPAKKVTIKEKYDELKPNFFNRLIQGVFDEFHSIKKYDDESYMKAVLSKSVDGALDGLLMNGQVYIKDGALDIKRGTKGLTEILQPLGTDVERYQIWKALNRDIRLPENKRSFKSLTGDINQLTKGDINGKPRKQLYEQALKEENELNKSVLDVAKQQGIIDDEAYKIFSEDMFYIPFYKEMENGEVSAIQASSKLANQKFSHALKGGEKERMGDLMENVLRNWSHILSASMKNAAAVSTLKSAEQLNAATKVKSTYEGKDVVKVMENGKQAYYAVNDPNLIDSISLISYLGPKSVFTDVAKAFTNALRYGVTLSPGYKIRNLIRDTVSSAAVSPIGMNMLDTVQRGMSLSDRGNPTFISALAGGGVFELGAAHEGNQAALIKRLIAKGVKDNTILDTPEKIKDSLKGALEWYNQQGNRFENANRLALYDKMIAEGKTHLEASFAARDLLNFTGQGSFRAIKFVSQVVPFFNTRLQGLYKLGRDGITPTYRVLCNMTTGKPIEESDKLKAQRFSIVSTAVMLASIGLYLSYKDDDEFKKREDWDRDNFWWFRIGDEAFRVPKPFEIGALGTIAERSVEQMADESVEGKVFVDRLRAVIMDNLSMNPTPQAIKPIFDIYANKDSFTGAPIETSGMERLSKQQRISNNTSELGKLMGGISEVGAKIISFNPDAEGLSPVQIDYALKSYFGWLGSTVATVADKAVEPWSDVEKPRKPVLDQYAMGFVKTLPETQSKYVTDFYNNNSRINQAFADMKRFAENNETEKVSEILKDKGDLISLQRLYSQTTEQLATYRKYINIITNDKNMSREDKENQILRMKILISQAAENAENIRKSLQR